MKDAMRRVAKLESQPPSSPRNSRLSRALDGLSVDECILLADTPIENGNYVGSPERLDSIAKVLAKVHAFDG